MDIAKRLWWVRYKDQEEGPIPEDLFQTRLRAGELPLKADIRSNYDQVWKPLLDVVAKDETFRRASTAPPPEPSEPKRTG